MSTPPSETFLGLSGRASRVRSKSDPSRKSSVPLDDYSQGPSTSGPTAHGPSQRARARTVPWINPPELPEGHVLKPETATPDFSGRTEIADIGVPVSKNSAPKKYALDSSVQGRRQSTKAPDSPRTLKRPSTLSVSREPLADIVDYPDEIVDRSIMQANSYVHVLPKTSAKPEPEGDTFTRKQVIDEDSFERACQAATVDPMAAAETLAALAEEAGPPAFVEFAKICFSGPVGRVGSRRALRAVGVALLDKVIAQDPDYADALCAKGEALLPPTHIGKADADAPGPVLKEVFKLFTRAAKLGSVEGRFLRGRWLLSMYRVHRSSARANEGKEDIKYAAERNHPRALVFLAQCYEFPRRFGPVSFTRDLPNSQLAREKVILNLYMKAAELGDPDALNDVGSSYATAYAGLDFDFDIAARYYVRAIQAGSLHAFDNLGTHYETGMGGREPERIDVEKALHYYRHGARMRCSKCSHNLGSAYEEGISGVVDIDTAKAEKYYRHTLYLADDDNDTETASRALKDLMSLYVTRLKINDPESEIVAKTMKRLRRYMPVRMLADTLADVNKAISLGVRSRRRPLVDLLGERNGTLVLDHATELIDRVYGDNMDGELSETDKAIVNHVFGSYAPDSLTNVRSGKGKGKGVKRRRKTE